MRDVGDLEGETHTVTIPGPDGPAPAQIVINRQGGRIVEIFVHGVRGRDRALANALGRLVSLAVSHGVLIEDVARTLRGIGGEDPPVAWLGGGICTSLPDALARLLEREVGIEL